MVRKKGVTALLLLLVIASNLNAQTVDFEWAEAFAPITPNPLSVANGVVTDASGNVYTCGMFTGITQFDWNGTANAELTSNGFEDIYISKHDAAGNFLWVKQIGGIGADQATAITIDPNGDLLIGGVFEFTVDFDPNSGVSTQSNTDSEDIFILKIDVNGNFLWVRSIEGSGLQSVSSIFTDAGGNLFTTGYFGGTVDLDPGAGASSHVSNGATDAFIQKLDANGNFQWGKTFGGSLSVTGRSAVVDNAGNIFICGYFQGTVDFDPNTGVVTGSSAGSDDGFLVKLDANGNYVWSHTLGGTGFDGYLDMAIDSNDDLVLGGAFSGSVDFDPTAGTSMESANGSADIFVQKLDANGNFLWTKTNGGQSFDIARRLTVDANNDIYVTSRFGGNMQVDPITSQNLMSNGSNDIAIQKFSTSGNFQWATSYGGAYNDQPRDIEVTASGNVYTVGRFISIVDFDPTSGIYYLTNNVQNLWSAFLQKLSQVNCTPTFGTDAQTACNSFTWIDGNIYTSSNNTATFSLQNAAGCDSIVTLDLTINTVNTTTSTTEETITADAQNATYQWIDCDNNNASISGETSQFFTANSNGNYAVIVTENNCSDTSICIAITTVGLEETNFQNGVSIYPNPSKGQVKISFDELQGKVVITITDLHGRIISENRFINVSEAEIQLGDTNGMYLVRIASKGQSITEIICKL